MELYTPVVVATIPVLIAGAKVYLPLEWAAALRPYWSSVATVLGAAADALAQLATTSTVRPHWAMLAGLASVGLREFVVQASRRA